MYAKECIIARYSYFYKVEHSVNINNFKCILPAVVYLMYAKECIIARYSYFYDVTNCVRQQSEWSTGSFIRKYKLILLSEAIADWH